MAIRVGVIGSGFIGAMHASIAAAHPQASLVAVCDPCSARRQALAERFGARAFEDEKQMVASGDVDLVCIASPDELHVQHAKLCVNAGKHVFCEKPLGDSLEAAEELLEIANRQQVQFGINFNRRFAFGYRRMKELLDQGAIGRLRQLCLQVSDGTPPPHVNTRPDVMYWTLLGHHFDLLRWLGGPVERIFAFESRREPEGTIVDLAVNTKHQSGLLGNMTVAYRDGQARTAERCEMIGSEGSIVVDDVSRALTHIRLNPDVRSTEQPNLFEDGDRFYESLCGTFVRVSRLPGQGTPPPVGLRDAIESIRLSLAAIDSHETCQVVTVQ